MGCIQGWEGGAVESGNMSFKSSDWILGLVTEGGKIGGEKVLEGGRACVDDEATWCSYCN